MSSEVRSMPVPRPPVDETGITDGYLAIDESGYPIYKEARINDPMVAREILTNIKITEKNQFITQSSLAPQSIFVEAFDEPYVARRLNKNQDKKWQIRVPFELDFEISLDSFCIDHCDRFHGRAKNGVPFVLTRPAQEDLFRLVDNYDDDTITIGTKTYPTPFLYTVSGELAKADWWTERYNKGETGWELQQPAPALVDMLPRLKLPKSRVLILGCGSGEDAALWARGGHIVTAVDFSTEALRRAKEKFPTLANVKWVEGDAFALNEDYTESFDVIYEHTFMCAIDPTRRDELVDLWRRCLIPNGHLFAVLMACDKPTGPSFGGSEWEYRQRLQKHFRFLFWGRWRKSLPSRQARELFVYAQKLK